MAQEFTIIMPVLNRSSLIVRALDSIKGQSYRPLRIIVVDNGSTDDTMSVATRWGMENTDADLRLSILQETRPGAAVARNKGLEEAHTDWVLFFDSDDSMRPDLVESVAKAIDEHPEAEIVAWRARIHYPGRSWVPFFATSDYLHHHIVHAVLATQKYAVRRRRVVQCGGWSNECDVWNDWEIGVRLLRRCDDASVAPIDRVLCDIHHQTDSITGDGFYHRRGRWERVIDLVERELEQDERPDEKALRLLDYRRAVLAAHYRREGHRKEASELLQRALAGKHLSRRQRRALRWAYRLTAHGIRGVARVITPLL